MNLQQIKTDFDNDVIVCRSTLHKLLDHALELEQECIAQGKLVTSQDEALALLEADKTTYTVDGVVMGPYEYIEHLHGMLHSQPDPSGADGDWLWGRLMDWCKKRGLSPAKYNDLFGIVSDLRALAIPISEGKGQQRRALDASALDKPQAAPGDAGIVGFGSLPVDDTVLLREPLTVGAVLNEAIERFNIDGSVQTQLSPALINQVYGKTRDFKTEAQLKANAHIEPQRMLGANLIDRRSLALIGTTVDAIDGLLHRYDPNEGQCVCHDAGDYYQRSEVLELFGLKGK